MWRGMAQVTRWVTCDRCVAAAPSFPALGILCILGVLCLYVFIVSVCVHCVCLAVRVMFLLLLVFSLVFFFFFLCDFLFSFLNCTKLHTTVQSCPVIC